MAVTVFANATLVLPDRLVPGRRRWPSQRRADRGRRRRPRAAGGDRPRRRCTSRRGSSICTSTAATGPTSWTAPRRRSAPCAGATPATARRASCRPAPSPRDEQYLRVPRAVPASCTATSTPAARASSAAHFYGPYFARAGPRLPPGPGLPRPPTPADARAVPRSSPTRCRSSSTVAPEIAGRRVAGAGAAASAACAFNAGHTPRHVRAGGGGRRLGRAARRSPVLRDVRPRPAAADADVPDARRRDGGDAVLRRTDDRGDRRRQAPARRELLRLAYKVKGPDRLALVTDCDAGRGHARRRVLVRPRRAAASACGRRTASA